MSYVKIILHCVWSTKNRQPLLSDRGQRETLFAHICANAKEKGIWVSLVGGYVDHLHLILYLGKDQIPSKILQLIKGEAFHWFNQQYAQRLEWQDDYFTVSIGEKVSLQLLVIIYLIRKNIIVIKVFRKSMRSLCVYINSKRNVTKVKIYYSYPVRQLKQTANKPVTNKSFREWDNFLCK